MIFPFYINTKEIKMGALLNISLNIPNHFLIHCQSPCVNEYCCNNPCVCDVEIDDSGSDSAT